MKKLNINKLSEYPVVNIEEQTSLKGGVSQDEFFRMLENNTWQGGYVDGYGYAAPAVTIYGTSWNETGRWDIDGCPARGNGSRQGWNTNQTAAEDNLVTRLTHFFFHKHAYYGDK